MAFEYNKLTKRLLAEGYTAENHPPYVKVGSGRYGSDPLQNISGGFEYTRTYAESRTYETPCGILCKGLGAFDMTYCDEFSHENDNPIIHCPYRYLTCDKRPEWLEHNTFCSVHITDREYEYKNSAEEIRAREEKIRKDKYQQYIKEHPRHCPNHLKWDDEKRGWVFRYAPMHCRVYGCIGKVCPVLGKEIRNIKGNIYYDIEAEYPDKSKDGTFFEGERIHSKITGNQYFEKPELIDICEACLRVEKDLILYNIEINKLPKLYGTFTLFQAKLGKIDFQYKITNMRVERKNVRDLEQDLQDIKDGILVSNAAEMKAKEKQDKSNKRAEAKIKRENSARKLIIKKGLLDMNESERRSVTRILGKEEVIKAQHEHEAEVEKQKNAPVQMSLFDFM